MEATIAAEAFFSADSDAVLAILCASAGDGGRDLRWRACLWGLDKILSDLGFDVEAKRETVGHWHAHVERAGTLRAEGKQQLSERFRAERRRLELLVSPSTQPDAEMEPVRVALEIRSELMAGVVRRLKSLAAAGRLSVEIPELASSYAHMHVNRMMRSDAPTHEFVLYDFLLRLYAAEIGRRRRGGAHRLAGQEGQVLLTVNTQTYMD